MTFPSRIQDGTAHLAFFDPRMQLSFVWNGLLAEPIEVQPGGDGEPTTALIPLTSAAAAAVVNAGDALPAVFQTICEQWIRTEVHGG